MAETYVEIGQLRGPQGERGVRGDVGPAGARGPEGPRGERGYPGSFHSVGATSIPAGEQAWVELMGDELYKHAQFFVPRGLPTPEAVPTDEFIATAIAAADTQTRQELDPVIAEGALAVAMPRQPMGDLIANDPAAATVNTTRIQAALDDAFCRVVHVPEGLFYVNALTIPQPKHLTGEFAREYTTVATRGTRLRAADAAQTAPVITMHGRSLLTNIGVYGAGSGTGANHDVVAITSNGPIIRDASIGFGGNGINAKYHLVELHNVHVFMNGRGISDVLDGKVVACTVNANASHGVYCGKGANATQYIGNRVEWNDGNGFNLFETNNVTLLGNIVDRNGLAGFRLVNNSHLTIGPNQSWRNGRLAQGNLNEDCHFYMQGNSHYSMTGNVTKTGVNDDGTGYNSPLNTMRLQANAQGVVVGNDLSGATGSTYSVITSDAASVEKIGNVPVA